MSVGSEWHEWFAWRPVRTVDGQWVWLCSVQRREVYEAGWWNHGGYFFREYWL